MEVYPRKIYLNLRISIFPEIKRKTYAESQKVTEGVSGST